MKARSIAVTSTTDEALVKKALAGDNTAFGLLMLRYQAEIFDLAHRYLGNCVDAEDLSQEAFSEAYMSLRNLHDPTKFASWLRSITKHLCVSWLRRQPKSVSYEELMSEGNFGSLGE